MVAYTPELDRIFIALADPTRRDIVARLRYGQLNVTEIAQPYTMSIAAVSKHIHVLERASLVVKRKAGSECYVATVPETMKQVAEYVQHYEMR